MAMPNEMEPQGEMQQEQQDPAMEQQEPTQEPTQDASGGGKTSDKIKAQIKVPPELKNAYERIVTAGMKVMFSQETHAMAMKSMEGDGPVEQRLATGIAQLMAILWKQSNQSMPPQLIVPAGIDLLLEAVDFLNEAGQEQVSEQQMGEAIRLMIGGIMEQFQVTEENVKKGQAEQAAGRGQRPPGAQGGIVGNAMGGQ